MTALEIIEGQLAIEVVGIGNPVFDFFISKTLACKLKRKALKQIAQGSVIRVGELNRLARIQKIGDGVVIYPLLERMNVALIERPNGIAKRIPIVAGVDPATATWRIAIRNRYGVGKAIVNTGKRASRAVVSKRDLLIVQVYVRWLHITMNNAELSVKQVNRMTQLRNHAAFDHVLATGTIAKTGSLGSDGNIPKLGSYGPHFGRT